MIPDHNDFLLQRARKGRSASEWWLLVLAIVVWVVIGVGTVTLVRG